MGFAFDVFAYGLFLMNARNLSCPNCGYGFENLRKSTRMFDCPSCDTTLFRESDALAPMGFEPLVAAEHRLPMLTSMRLPEAVRTRGEADVRRALLLEHGIEVGGGLGALAGDIWRIGLMGENARVDRVERLATALAQVLG